MRYQIRLASLLLVLTTPTLLYGNDTISDYLFRDIRATQLQQKNVELTHSIEAERIDESLALGKLMVEIAESDETIDKISFARALSNYAVIQAMMGDRGVAVMQSDRAIELIEAFDPFHPDLFNILMVRSYTENAEDLFTEAEDSLRRAQHIVHRQDGVYSRRQLPVIKAIAGVKMAQGAHLDADLEQRFNLKVSEKAYGQASEELMPTLNQLGNYFANRGASIAFNAEQEERMYRDRLFREATRMFERSISIIEDKYGDTDLRLVEPLKGLARAKFKRGTGLINAERPMERALSIVRGNPATDKADHAKALVDLADLYTLTSDSRAGDLYIEAWQLLSDDQAQEQLQYELFARPKRLHPEVPIQPVLFRHPVGVEKGEELFVDIRFDIREDGRVRNAVIQDGNVANSDRKQMRNFVAGMRYRPRVVEGELAETEGMDLHQNYLFKERIPETKISISTGVGAPN